MTRRIDLHMHTTHSDGSYTPADLMAYCSKKGLGCVSVTDHDTLSSFPEARRAAEGFGIELVPGVEISAIFEPGTLHILGYFVDPRHPAMAQGLEEVQKARRVRNPQVIEKLNKLGVKITLQEVEEEAGVKDGACEEKQIGRPHFAKALLKKGHIKNLDEAFSRYLGKGKPAYVDKRTLSSKEAIRMIREAGGIASVAHPKQMKLQGQALEKEIARLVDEGLGGIEVYNSCQNVRENEAFLKIAKRFDLVPTGGSDFHGANKPDVDLGYLGEGIALGDETLEALRKKTGRA